MGVLEDMEAKMMELEARIDRLEGGDGVAKDLSWAKTMDQIARAVARHYRLTLDDLRSADRGRRVAWPRQEAMLAMSRAGFTNGQIGLFLRRDTSTICAGIAAASQRLK